MSTLAKRKNVNQAELLRDVICLENRMAVIQDVVSYNATAIMGDKYQDWIEKHQALMAELHEMISFDLEKLKAIGN